MTAASPTRNVANVLAVATFARMPLAMLSIAILVHVAGTTGSYGAAGVVSAANALALGISGPALARVVDRRGQTAVLVAGGSSAGALVVALALAPATTPLVLLVALAAAAGIAAPPIGACVRSLLPSLVPDPARQPAAFAVEASTVELTWVVGPSIVLGIAAAWSTTAALACVGIVLAVGTAAFAALQSSRTWTPVAADGSQRASVLGVPALRTLALAMLALGVVVGAVEVGVAAAAARAGHADAAGPLLGLWGLGSLTSGIVAARLGGSARDPRGLTAMLAALAAGHVVLAASAGGLVTLGAGILVAGAALAPSFAAIYALVERAAPRGGATEAFAWLATALSLGGALGSAVAGVVVDRDGASAALGLGAAAAIVAAIVVASRACTLPGAAQVAEAPAAIAIGRSCS